MRPTSAGYSVRLAAARAALAALSDGLGTPGLAAAARVPGLLAAVDQHAAALRDTLTAGHGRAPSAVGLAGYAEGLRETATRLGWQAPEQSEVDWARAPWLLVRLLAVCQLAAAAG